jgi:hypothetical protein
MLPQAISRFAVFLAALVAMGVFLVGRRASTGLTKISWLRFY